MTDEGKVLLHTLDMLEVIAKHLLEGHIVRAYNATVQLMAVIQKHSAR